jgi:DNA-binding response OmpR family regulator
MQPRLLVLDDEETIGQVISLFFEGKGFEVVAVKTSKDAMEAVDHERFDLAIFDVNLAGENGLELVRFFKTNFPQLPIIILTGMPGSEELVEQALLRGANGFMRKTDPLENLFDMVRSYVRKP